MQMIKKLDGGLYELFTNISMGKDKGYVQISAVGYDLNSLIKSGVYYILAKDIPSIDHRVESNRFVVRYITQLFEEYNK